MPAGYAIRGIEPREVRTAADPVRLMWWSWVVEEGLLAKDRDLARGLDAFGDPLRPISPKTRRYRRSEMGPADPAAPPLMPARKLSRTRSLLAGKAFPTHAEFYWRFDAFTHDTWAKILTYHQEKGRDVFGIAPESLERVRLKCLARWRAWLRSGEPVPARFDAVAAIAPLDHETGRVKRPHYEHPPGYASNRGVTTGINGGPSPGALASGNWSGWQTEAELRAWAKGRAPANVQARPSATYNRLLSHVWGQPDSGASPVGPLAAPPRRRAPQPADVFSQLVEIRERRGKGRR